MFFSKRSKPVQQFDPEFYQPVIRSSICTGEKVAGFKDRRDGRFIELCLVRSEADLERFVRQYGLDPDALRTEY